MGKAIPAHIRFWAKVEKQPDGCWLWTGGTSGRYGTFWSGPDRATGRMVLPHRWAWEQEHGPVPDGLELDHLCRNRLCVRPSHLEPVTHTLNVARGEAGEVNAGRQRSKTHCPQGHPYDATNTYEARTGGRQCLTCRTLRNRGIDPHRV